MFVKGLCPHCNEQIISEIVIDCLEEFSGTEDELVQFIFENTLVKRRLTLEQFIEEVRPALNAYVKINKMENGREFLIKTLGVSPSTADETINAIHAHLLGEIKRAKCKIN